MTRAARLVLAPPVALGALELSHPTWADGSVAQAVGGTGGWWIPLHVLLIAGFNLLVWALLREVRVQEIRTGTCARVLLLTFAVCNTVFLAVDGLGVGLLAAVDPQAADSLWSGLPVVILANVTGAAWSAALLCTAPALYAAGRARPQVIGLTLTWLAFLASAAPLAAVAWAAPPSRLLAAATGAWTVYAAGTSQVPFALLVFAAVLRQHVGAEAALGMLLIFLALAARSPYRTIRP